MCVTSFGSSRRFFGGAACLASSPVVNSSDPCSGAPVVSTNVIWVVTRLGPGAEELATCGLGVSFWGGLLTRGRFWR